MLDKLGMGVGMRDGGVNGLITGGGGGRIGGDGDGAGCAMCRPVCSGRQWQGARLGFPSLLGWIVEIFLPSMSTHVAEEASPGAGEAQACRGRCRRLSRTAACRALLG